ncbi:hypothetical protein NLU13_9148 [Sarocladium strictum]|uniref:DH domain-containing protein n=1 Tax=Sarocladium strictum TaxID=5046 RepID=A0AA39G9L7_SARSR|nr:hypothetical protein NLU13_9148 [Sarocladium strictum]
MALVESRTCSHHGSIHSTHSNLWSAPSGHVSLYTVCNSRPGSSSEAVERLSANPDGLDVNEIKFPGKVSGNLALGTGRCVDNVSKQSPVSIANAKNSDNDGKRSESKSAKPAPTQEKRSFNRWMKSLRRRAVHSSSAQSIVSGLALELESPGYPSQVEVVQASRHRKMSSDSSLAFITAVRSASVSLASMSAVARSKRTHPRSLARSRTDRSSRASFTAHRISEDSALQEQYTVPDIASVQRSAQRRRILEELINTEESYIGDLRFLMNVYITILASTPTLPAGLRTSINHNLTEIVQLHEEILGDLHRVVPDSEYTQPQVDMPALLPPTLVRRNSWASPGRHRRWKSLDAVPEQQTGVTWLQNVPGILSDPQTAAEVSKVFGKRINRFFIYEEYGAKYELMMKDVSAAHRSMPFWNEHQKGLEALASTVGSSRSIDAEAKKALTVGDLLVKPVQRICKYPLLFSELLKCTPVCDCPNSHMEIDDVLVRLREATSDVNRATNDKRMKSTLEKTWLLQDRLVFPNRKLDSASKNQIRSFGQMQMCGTLHVCWQTKESVEGQYLVCILYRDLLCLATAGKVDPVYTIVACISLAGVRIAEVDNGRGLQCHTAPHSWKLIFECDHQLYEIIMTACTPKEELEWRTRLNRMDIEECASSFGIVHSSLDLNIKSLGTIYGKQGTIARRISIHRATTIGPKSPMCQVILKNTSAIRESTNHANLRLGIHRSQSLLTTNVRMPVLAPARSERARLENLLTDVWSRDKLPFPGMTARVRSEHLVRSSASSVMRKLSVASITNSFNKRSRSLSQG